LTLYGADGRTLVDVHALPIDTKDLVILRSDREFDLRDYEELQRTVLASNPEWRGGLLVLKTDEMVEKLDEKTLLSLYEILKKMFTNWEEYVSIREAEIRRCLRCGQTVPEQEAAPQSAAKKDDSSNDSPTSAKQKTATIL